MHYLFTTLGTRGYVLPFLPIALRLKQQGHRVTLMAEHGYAQVAGYLGIEYVSLSSPEEAIVVSRDKRQFLHSRYDLLFMKKHIVKWNQRILEKIRECLSEDLVIVSADRITMWADLEARRLWSVRVVRAAIDLPALRNEYADRLPAGDVQRTLARQAESEWHQAMSQMRLHDPHPVFRMMGRQLPFVQKIALWPDWLVPGDKYNAFGFMPAVSLSNGDDHRADMVFLAGTEGSIDEWAVRFAESGAAACHELGLSGLMLGGNGMLSGTRFKDVPFSNLANALRGASAIVHHGGVGTIAQALESGVPQLVIPRVAGQHSNVEWLRRLGLCRVLRPEEWTKASAGPTLRTVMSEFCKSTAHHAATQIDRQKSLEDVCQFLISAA